MTVNIQQGDRSGNSRHDGTPWHWSVTRLGFLSPVSNLQCLRNVLLPFLFAKVTSLSESISFVWLSIHISFHEVGMSYRFAKWRFFAASFSHTCLFLTAETGNHLFIFYIFLVLNYQYILSGATKIFSKGKGSSLTFRTLLHSAIELFLILYDTVGATCKQASVIRSTGCLDFGHRVVF